MSHRVTSLCGSLLYFMHDKIDLFRSRTVTKLWSLEHYVGSPQLEYNSKRRVHKLVNPRETLAALDAAVLRTTVRLKPYACRLAA